MPFVEIEVNSTQELVQRVLALGRQADGSVRPLWHRGHLAQSWGLIPSLYRKLGDPAEIFPTELRVMTRFRQRSLPYWAAGYPQNGWEHLFAMQHYGIPTRLLDWSENLMMALYFAAVPASTSFEDDTEDPPVIWTVDPVRWNNRARNFEGMGGITVFTIHDDEMSAYAPPQIGGGLPRRYPAPIAIYGTYNSPRIVAQRGTFMVGGQSLESFDAFVPADESLLWRIALRYPRQQMLTDLEILGFTESMVFPDLVGLGKEITASEGLR